MLEFLLALALFLLSHGIPARPAIRTGLIGFLGERLYVIFYSILSLGLLAWLISAAMRAPHVSIWLLAPWQYWIPLALMPFAFILFVAGAISPNPLSVSFRRRSWAPERPGIVAVTRHPILWGFALWSLSHLIPNGDLVSLIMFGGFGLFALAAMPLIDRRKRRQLGEAEWRRLAAGTSVIPFAGTVHPRSPSPLLAAGIIGGIVCYALMLRLHPMLIGPDPLLVIP